MKTYNYQTMKLYNTVIQIAPALGILKDWIHRDNVVKMRRPLPNNLNEWLLKLDQKLGSDIMVSHKVTETHALHRAKYNVVVTLTATA